MYIDYESTVFVESENHTTKKKMLMLSIYLAQIYDIIQVNYFDVIMHTKDTSSWGWV